jgi:hypothetical protein
MKQIACCYNCIKYWKFEHKLYAQTENWCSYIWKNVKAEIARDKESLNKMKGSIH